MRKYTHAHRRNRHGNDKRDINPNGKIFAYGTIAQFNRWTHKPHEHQREIARRLRQSA